MTYRMLTSNIQDHQQSIFDLQQQISSGRRVSRPSDDPGSYEIITSLNSDASNNAQYVRNSERGKQDLITLDGTLQNALNIFHRADEIAVRASDGSVSASDRMAMADEVDQLYGALLDLANSSEGGRYTFAGLRTDTVPFDGQDTDLDGHIDYYGSDQVRMVEIGKGIYIETNIPGRGSNGVFQSNIGQPDEVDLFDNLIQLRDTLQTGQSPVGTTITKDLNGGIEHIITVLTTVGARQERMDVNSEILSQRETNLTNALDSEESLDIAAAVTKLSRTQLAYQAALRTTSSILGQKSLIDYI